jgi:hypothetical protein
MRTERERTVEEEIILGLADSALEYAFGPEYINLERGKWEVLQDFAQSGVSARVYRARIYEGHLQGYADTLLAGQRRK